MSTHSSISLIGKTQRMSLYFSRTILGVAWNKWSRRKVPVHSIPTHISVSQHWAHRVNDVLSSGLPWRQRLWQLHLGRCDIWSKSSWRRSSLAPLQSCQAGDSRIGEQLYQRSSHPALKVPGPTTDFPTRGSGKWTEYPQRIWSWRSEGVD